MKLFAGGIMTETNTFAPFPTGMADYQIIHAADFMAGQSSSYGNALDIWHQEATKLGWDFVPGLLAWAQPAGITPRPVYEALRDELLNDLQQAMPVDVVLLSLHGAMVAGGYDDCETDIVDRVRQIVGPTTPIGIELDLHCDLTEQLMEQSDLIVLYKEYPHTDVADRARELFELVRRTAEGEIRPTMAAFDCKMIGYYLTPYEPMRSFVEKMMAREGQDGVLSLSLFHTFPWADVPSQGVKMLAISDNDPDLAAKVAAEFGQLFYSLRHELQVESLPMDTAIDRAMAHPAGPIVLADQADNAGGGAPSDSTFVLRRLLERGIENAALGMIWDPIAVQTAFAAGEGGELELRLGGKMGPMSGDPLDLRVKVTKLKKEMIQLWPQGKNEPLHINAGDVAALHCQGIDIIINSRRGQVFSPTIFTDLGIDAAHRKLLVVKSTQHFYAGFAPMAAEIIYMSAPGAITPRFKEIPYKRVDTHKFPWIDDPFRDE